MLTEDTARSIGMSSYFPHVRRVFVDILRALDVHYGRPLMMTSTQNVNKVLIFIFVIKYIYIYNFIFKFVIKVLFYLVNLSFSIFFHLLNHKDSCENIENYVHYCVSL